jgi:uncharacterized surface anchored protein
MRIRKTISLLLAAVLALGAFTTAAPVAFAEDGDENYPLNSIVIKIEDIVTHQLLGGATFELYKTDTAQSGSGSGTKIATMTTDGSGVIIISGLESGYYVVRQTVPPNNYHLSIDSEQHCYLKPDGTSVVELTFSNYRYGGLLVFLDDKDTGAPIAGATFKVTDVDGKVVGNSADGIYTTDAHGEFYLENLPAGDYVITQMTPAQGYAMDSSPNARNVRLQHTNADQSIFRAQFSNSPLGSLLVRVRDSISNGPIAGARFSVRLSGGADLGEFETGAGGTFTLSKIARGTYIITQISAPVGYLLESTAKTQYVGYVNTYAVDILNRPKSGLYVTKYDAETKAPLQDARFNVYLNSDLIGNYTTNADGVFFIPNLTPGWYTVSEYAAPQGYILDDTPQSVQVIAEQLHRLEFENRRLASLQIIKTDEFDGTPLAGAKFRVTLQNGQFVADVTTDNSGKATVPSVTPGWYVISETKAPTGYLITESARTVEVKATVPTVVTITNRAVNNLEIVKLDAYTRAPLAGATFRVEHSSGENVGTFNTDSAGKILVGNLAEDTYVVSEIKAPDGYQLDAEPQIVVVEGGRLRSVEFLDKPLSGIEIIKTDEVSHAPLAGATFAVERDNGEKIGTHKTDTAGKIIVSGLTEGTYIVTETIAPDGYILDSAPQTVVVKSGRLSVAEFTNKPLSGLQITKLNSATRQPVEGAEFSIVKIDGERVGTYKTNAAGIISVNELEPGWYTVTEIKAADGYILDAEPRSVEITHGKPATLEVLNTPMSGLLIVKTDEATGRPLKGVVFDVRRADGQLVSGDLLDGNQPNTENNSPNGVYGANGSVAGSYTTDANGRIVINGLDAGLYLVTERKALDGYELDGTVRSVTVTAGKLATLQITNRQKSGLRLLKIDAMTKTPIYNVEFTVFDADNKTVGTYYTDNNGLIDFSGILTAGRYTIRETRPAAGYYADDVPRTVQFEAGKITEIRWENTPQMGQIQLLKKSGDDNEINGLNAGSPLEGAVFEVYNYKSGNLVDRFASGSNGWAVSNALPLGRYIVKEVQAPQWYRISDRELDIEIEFATQIIKQEYLNYSANTGVTIRKTGNLEAMANDEIRYDIKEVRNTGTVPLTDFYWRDVLPTDAVRLTKVITGTYNQSLKYKIMVTTNKGDTVIVADNLSTTKNNSIDCSAVALGLGSDEYVKDISFVFGSVKAGFCQVLQPQVYVKVLPNLPNEYRFVNRADVGGKYGREWIVGNSTWSTKIYAKPGKLPRTGY